ncbi:MAG: Cu(I)/Ag(I) efflux system membrane protein CusA/SilA [Limisphaerales bacterium]|jgi:Cu(I)/Ag(I) efflux system membrane protein CusA/SilA
MNARQEPPAIEKGAPLAPRPSPLSAVIEFCLRNKLIVFLGVAFLIGWGVLVAPFDWKVGGLPRDPVPVDAIPDIGENQQIVFTSWMGRSPQDVEDQITYPLTVSLLGVPGVKTVRCYSMMGFSTIYVIFKEDVEFYWSRSRILEKLNSLPAGTLPAGVQPALGPDATALGQVYWYTIEGRDPQGNPTGGWDLDEIRSAQDWYVRYGLLAAEGVSEVASVGGFVKEYQIDVDPHAMRAHGVSLDEVFMAVKMSNVDVGARTIEINSVEYVIRGLGFIESLEDVENSVIKVNDSVPIYVKNVATVSMGPALRRGLLDKAGAEAVGGVVVVRYGENPLAAIKNVKAKIAEISPGMPRKVLPDGTVSQLTIVPFYDRTGLINETLETLKSALTEEILIAIIVVLVMVMHLRTSILITGLVPLAVLMCFGGMKLLGVDANIVALSGIAIAIGTMVDIGIVISENILKRLEEAQPSEDRLQVVLSASREVGGAALAAVATTIISFLPVFTMEAAEGKLFRPLAWTTILSLIASAFLALTVIPPLAHTLLAGGVQGKRLRRIVYGAVAGLGVVFALLTGWLLVGFLLTGFAVYQLATERLPEPVKRWTPRLVNATAAAIVAVTLANHWLPLGPERGATLNVVFVACLIGGLLIFVFCFQAAYRRVLTACLRFKAVFLAIPVAIVILGATIWLGFDRTFGWLPKGIRTSAAVSNVAHAFPGLGKEFMPSLDEGAYLYMPTTMPHASIGEALDVIQKQDILISQIPEVETAVGKLGRAETPLDPAPISMIETIVNYRPEFLVDDKGHRLTFRFDPDANDIVRDEAGAPVPAPDGQPYTVAGKFQRGADGQLIPDSRGAPFRLWRRALKPKLNEGRNAWPGIRRPDDIWDEIVKAAEIPGTTSAPKLQPIAARLVMLQSGMRAPMGVKIKGPDLATIERVGLQMESFLKEVPSIKASAVIADRIVGKPYLEIDIDRNSIARYGIKLAQVQEVIEVAIGGKRVTTTVEGRERYPVRVRYQRELRDSAESLERILVPSPTGAQIPLSQLATINYLRGPQVIKSEDTFLIGYVLFDMEPGFAEVDVVETADAFLKARIASGEFDLPNGVSYTFAGAYENQVRSEKQLMIVLPLALFAIFIILYLQFKSAANTMLIFTGIAVAWAGGFILLWLYGLPGFLDINVFGANLRELFQVRPFNLSVAVWVGFLALFGIASDDGVIMTTFLNQSFANKTPKTIGEIRDAVIAAGLRRVRPCLMTSATTILALVPVLTSTGRGSDIMVPMAIPTFGGMAIVTISMFVVPVLFCATKEFALRTRLAPGAVSAISALTLFVAPLLYCAWLDVRDSRLKHDEKTNPKEPQLS